MNRLQAFRWPAICLLHLDAWMVVVSHHLHQRTLAFSRYVREVDEEEEKRQRKAELDKLIAEMEAIPPDRYSIDLTAWNGPDGEPVKLLEMTPEQFSALQYTASAKHVAVETLLSEAVRKAVSV